jgi:hypothetical protein
MSTQIAETQENRKQEYTRLISHHDKERHAFTAAPFNFFASNSGVSIFFALLQ